MMPATVPGAPSTPTILAQSATSISVQWTFNNALAGGTPVTGYTVYWDNGISGQTLIASASTGLWTTYTTAVGTLTAGNTYSFWVAAINYIGTGSPTQKLAVLAA